MTTTNNHTFITTELPTPSNVTNGTAPTVIDPETQKVIDALLVVIIVVIMLAAGCTIELQYLKKQFRRPIGIGIGLLCQFVIFPPIFFGMAHAMKLDKWNALGAVLVGTSPGGTLSNLFTIWTSGDVALSVSMTAVSTLLALGMMPLNLFIYTRSWTEESAVIPYVNIVITLATVLVPGLIGMLIRKKLPKVAKLLLVIGSAAGCLFIVAVIVLAVIVYPAIFDSPWEVWVAAAIMPAFGLFCGYFISSIACLPHTQRRAVSIETCSQNTSLCATMIILSFPPEIYPKVVIFAAMYSVFVSAELGIFTGVFRAWNCIVQRKCTCHTPVKNPEDKSITNGQLSAKSFDNVAYENDNVRSLQYSHQSDITNT